MSMTKAQLQRFRADNQAARSIIKRWLQEDLPIVQMLTQAAGEVSAYIDALEAERDEWKRKAQARKRKR